MGPALPDRVEVADPSEAVRDPDTGNLRPGAAAPRTIRANLTRLSSRRQSQENNAGQSTVVSDWVVLVEPQEQISPAATIKALTGRYAGKVFEVADLAAGRRSGLNGWRGVYVAVPLRLVSDLQPVTS